MIADIIYRSVMSSGGVKSSVMNSAHTSDNTNMSIEPTEITGMDGFWFYFASLIL